MDPPVAVNFSAAAGVVFAFFLGAMVVVVRRMGQLEVIPPGSLGHVWDDTAAWYEARVWIEFGHPCTPRLSRLG